MLPLPLKFSMKKKLSSGKLREATEKYYPKVSLSAGAGEGFHEPQIYFSHGGSSAIVQSSLWCYELPIVLGKREIKSF